MMKTNEISQDAPRPDQSYRRDFWNWRSWDSGDGKRWRGSSDAWLVVTGISIAMFALVRLTSLPAMLVEWMLSRAPAPEPTEAYMWMFNLAYSLDDTEAQGLTVPVWHGNLQLAESIVDASTVASLVGRLTLWVALLSMAVASVALLASMVRSTRDMGMKKSEIVSLGLLMLSLLLGATAFAVETHFQAEFELSRLQALLDIAGPNSYLCQANALNDADCAALTLHLHRAISSASTSSTVLAVVGAFVVTFVILPVVKVALWPLSASNEASAPTSSDPISNEMVGERA